jgi:hypothetical protein
MGATRAPVTAVAAVIGGVLLVAVLVTWAASIGPSGVLTGEGPEAERLTPSRTTSLDAPTDSVEQVQDRLAEKYAGDHQILRAIALVLEVVALLAVLFVMYRIGRWAWQTYDARRRPDPPPEDVEFDVLEGPRRLAAEISRDAAEQRRVLLEEGSPRNAIVECWHRFEQQAAGAGLERHPWETSSEFTLRMLDLVSADSHAVAELAVLYREARFSTHTLDEATRQRAVADLDAIHAGLLAGRGRQA